MRLIDADKIFRRVKESTASKEVKCLAEVLVATAPTVDAVVVTRCKDCKHYANHPNGMCYLHTEPKANARGYVGEAVCVEPDGFCSYGEPREW